MTINKTVVVSGIIGFFLTTWKQENEVNIGNDYNWEELLINTGLAMTAGYVCSKIPKPSKLEKSCTALSTNQQLRKVLASQKKQTDCKEECIIEEVRKYIDTVYEGKLEVKVSIHGSRAKKLDSLGSDTDLLVKFKEDSFERLEDMAYDVYCNLACWSSDRGVGTKVRKQRVSTGIIIGNDHNKINIDIVPCRRTNNPQKEEYNLYKRSMKAGEQPSRIKINPERQKSIRHSKESIKDVIRLMRTYNKKIGKPMKSILVDTLVEQAFERTSNIPHKLEDKLLMTMAYFSEHIERITVKAPDNSNATLSDYTTSWQKKCIASNLQKDMKWE